MPPEEDRPSGQEFEVTRGPSESERRLWLEAQRVAAVPVSSFHPGDVLAGRFGIVRFLARGGMGEVYEAEDHHLSGARIALKTILPEIARQPGGQKRFEREVLLARQVTHPNVCPLYDIFFCEETQACSCFLIMKLLRGETLAQRLRRDLRVPVEEGLAILRQISSALHAAHQAGVVHRDLKPGNIMVEGSGREVKAVVTDFGLARLYEQDITLVTGGQVLGTPGYIAPEVLRGFPSTPAGDLYALGVVACELFTGRLPMSNPADPFSAVIPSDAPVSELPDFSLRLISACLDADPDVRSRAFEQSLEWLDPYAVRSPPYSAPKTWSRRKLLGAGATAMGALALSAWWERADIWNLSHPLPRKRFVAVMIWPLLKDANSKPFLSAVVDAIETELSRAEAFDRDLFVISSHDVSAGDAGVLQLQQVRDSLGANLILAASGVSNARQFDVLLKIIDASTNSVLRSTQVPCAIHELTSLTLKATRAAAGLLNVDLRTTSNELRNASAGSPAAYTAFEAAENLMKQPNDEGLDAAIAKYKEALDIDQTYAIAYARLALAYVRSYAAQKQGTYLDLALVNCQKALQLDATCIDAYLARASVYEHRGDHNKAVKDVDQALSFDPSAPKTLLYQAQIYGRMGRWNDAEKAYRRILKLRPNYWLAYNELGWLHNAEGQYAEAIEDFRKASVAAPKSALAFNNLGAIYLKLGKFQEAAENFRQSLRLKENDLAYSNLATCLRAQGKYSEALAYSLNAVNINPAEDQNWLDLGDSFASMPGKAAQAREAYSKAVSGAERRLETNPSDASELMLLALYRLKAGSPDGVPGLIQKAEALGATELESQFVEARILNLLNRRKEALQILSRCFARGMTKFEVEFIPDLEPLRKDPGYADLVRQHTAVNRNTN